MEKEIMINAIENFKNLTGLKVQYKAGNDELDGIINLSRGNLNEEFIIEVKKDIRNHQIAQLQNYRNKYPNFLLIAGRIYPKTKERLDDLDINYIEENGNARIKTDDFYIHIDTQKPINVRDNKGNRAFTPTGLKVVFQLLNDKNLLNQPQREIAEKANVGLGNIPQILKGLKDTGYIIPLNKSQYEWEDRKGLLNRWINDYTTILKPKLAKGRYTALEQWKKIQLDGENTVWGGEPGADLLTNYLRPEVFTLYTKELNRDLIQKYGIVPKENGEIEVYEMFFTPENGIAPPMLIYADLLLEGGKRNEETAKLIYDEYIQQIL